MRALALADAAAWHTARYVNELRRQGHTVYLASLQTGPLVDFQLPSVRYSAALSYMSQVSRIKALIDELQPEVVNAHFASAYGVMAARCRRRYGGCGASWALTVWGSDILVSPTKSYLHRRRIQYALNSADVILADSTFLAESAKALTSTPVKTILWGVERQYVADDVTLREKAKPFERERGPLKLLAPRPHRRLYNNVSLLTALAPLLQSGQATLTVNSTGDLYESFMKRAGELGVRDAVSVYRPCLRDEYLRMTQEHDIYLSAATSDSSPVSLIEALAVGVFPVCASHPGLSDLLFGERLRYSVYEPHARTGPCELIGSIIALEEGERLKLLRANRDLVVQKAIYEDNVRETAQLFEQKGAEAIEPPAEEA